MTSDARPAHGPVHRPVHEPVHGPVHGSVHGPVRLLTVCTGNVCRSPYAQLLLQHQLDQIRPHAFVVTSAGTHALVGHPVDPGSAALLEGQGVGTEGFRAAGLSSGLVRSQDFVLVMTEDHRELVVEEAPFAFRRVMPIRHVAHLLDVISAHRSWPELLAGAGAGPGPLGRWRALPEILARESQHIRRRLRDQHVTDPIGRSARTFAKMAHEIDDAVKSIVRWEASFAD